MVDRKKPKFTQPNQPTLSAEIAGELLKSSREYFSPSRSDYLNGRHKMEVIAEAMIHDGQFELADQVLHLHTVMKEFRKGKYAEAGYLAESPVAAQLLESASGTKYEAAAKDLVEPIVAVAKKLAGKNIDWAESAKVINDVKHSRFPEELSMVERMDRWNSEKPISNNR